MAARDETASEPFWLVVSRHLDSAVPALVSSVLNREFVAQFTSVVAVVFWFDKLTTNGGRSTHRSA